MAIPAMAQQVPSASAPVNVTAVTNTAAVLDQQLVLLQNAVEATDDQGKPMVDSSYRRNTLSSLARVQRSVENKDYRNALQMCDSLVPDQSSPAFRKMLKSLSNAISLQMKADQARLAQDVLAMIASVPTTCLASTNQSDLQALNVQIQQAQNSLSRMSDNDNAELPFVRQNLQNAQELIRQSMTCLAAEAAGDLAKALESINQMISMSAFPTLANNPELKKKQERLQAIIADETSKVTKAVREKMGEVSTSREAAALSRDFNREYTRLQRYSRNDPVTEQEMEGTRNTLNAWVRVIGAEERGDFQAALQALQNADNDYYGRMDTQLDSVVTTKRSALLLKLLNQPVTTDDPVLKIVSEQMAAVDSLDKLIALRRRLVPISSFSFSRMNHSMVQPEIQSLMGDIQALEVWHAALQARQYEQLLNTPDPSPYNPYASMYGSFQHRWKTIVNGYRNQMRVQALAEVFELKGFEPKEDQTIDQSLLQEADKAVSKKQWETVALYLDAYRVASFGSQSVPAALTDQINGCRNLIAARNYEKAGDIARAVDSYMAVLATPSKRTPVEDAFLAIARLRKDHPGIFEKTRDVSAKPTAATVTAP